MRICNTSSRTMGLTPTGEEIFLENPIPDALVSVVADRAPSEFHEEVLMKRKHNLIADSSPEACFHFEKHIYYKDSDGPSFSYFVAFLPFTRYRKRDNC